MKLLQSVEINRPLKEVILLFKKQDNRKDWMEGFMNSTLINGIAGEVGAKSKIEFVIGKRRIEMIETIKVSKLPDEYTCTYESKEVFNSVKCMFAEISQNSTDFCTVNEFQFKGIMKIIAYLMPNVFKKQGQKYLEDFKIFCEKSSPAV